MVAASSISVTAALLIFICGIAALTAVWQTDRRRIRQIESRVRADNRRREEIARDMLDTMIQRAQGFLLMFQGLSGELGRHDSMRRRMELVLDEADSWLAVTRARLGDWPTTEPIGDVAFELFRANHRLFDRAKMHFRTLTIGAPQVLLQSVADDLYRIGIEALTNARIHAHASRVELEIAYETGRLWLRVRDDGCGLNFLSLPSRGGPCRFGLMGIREGAHRMGGQFRLWSRESAGTEIEVVIPASRAYRHAQAVPPWTQALLFPRLQS